MGVMRTTQVRTLLVVHLLALLASYWGSWSWSWPTVLFGEAGLLLLVCLPLCRKSSASPLDPHFAGVPVPRFRSDLLKVENIAGIQFGGCTAQSGNSAGSSLSSSWCCIPHPAKAHRGGEDAVFVTPWSVGCADGVGGWAARGIDSGLYARGLMHGCERAAVEGQGVLRSEGAAGAAAGGGGAGASAGRGGLSAAAMEAVGDALNPVRLLKAGFDGVQRQHIIGSTTACVATYLPLLPEQQGQGDGAGGKGGRAAVAAGTMQVANLGDSGCMVIRDGRMVLRTVEQTHAFNFPRQLGTGSQDTPADADRLSIPVLPGDIIVLGTDGLFDNMFDDEILQLVVESTSQGNGNNGAGGAGGQSAEGGSGAAVAAAAAALGGGGFPSLANPAQAKDFAGVARCAGCIHPSIHPSSSLSTSYLLLLLLLLSPWLACSSPPFACLPADDVVTVRTMGC
jgi:protein phosphatase PTC7